MTFIIITGITYPFFLYYNIIDLSGIVVPFSLFLMFLVIIVWGLGRKDIAKRLRAKAVVIDLSQLEDEDGGITYRPILQFIDSRTGKQVTAPYERFGTGFKSYYHIGKEFDILYDPKNPSQDIIIDSFWHKDGLFILMIVTIGVFILIYRYIILSS
jgi:hypothetical protein